MRQIILSNNYYEIKGEITKRAISPWVARISSGGTTYEDYSQAALEEFHDFRNGIGKTRGVGSDARLQFSEGIDFTTEGQAVLGGLVTTAGAFGVAPVKIIDFQNKTYAIGSDGSIKEWNTVTSEWNDVSYVMENCEDVWNSAQHPNATHEVDAVDYKVGSNCVKITVNSAITNSMLAWEAISSKNYTAYSKIRAWIKSQLATAAGDLQLALDYGTTAWTSPTGFTDPGVAWTNEANAYDENTATYAYDLVGNLTWSDFLQLSHAAITTDKIRYFVGSSSAQTAKTMDLDIYYGAAWHHIFEEAVTYDSWQTKDLGADYNISDVRIRLYNDSGFDAVEMKLFELDYGLTAPELIDVPALTADTWTNITETITTPANLVAVTRVGIKSVTDLGAEPYIIRIDDFRAVDVSVIATTPIDAIVVTDVTDEYLVVSSATAAVYWAGGDTVEWAALTTVMGYLAFYDTKLWGITTTGGTLYYSAANDIDGAGGNFSLSGQFGTVYDLFEGKLLADGTPTLYFCGTEGLYTIDVANSKAYKQEVEYPPLTYSGHVGMYWNANVWVSTGFGILKVTPSMATFVGPDLDDGLPATYQGSVFDMVTVNNWLVYCTNKNLATDKSSIFKRNSSYGGSLQVYTSAANTAIPCLLHSSSSLYTNGRLWFGEGTDIKYMMFPDTTSNVKQITTYTYVDDSGYGTLPIFRKMAVIPKVALGVGAITKSCVSAATEYIQVFYGLNGAAATTSLGTFLTSPHPTILTFASGVGIEFYTIQFAIKLYRATANTTNSPELESLLFYYLPRPATISAWTFNIVATSENAEAIIAAFEAVRDTKTLVVFNETGDSDKTSFNHFVALSTMPLQFHVENQQTRAGIIQVTCEEIFNG